MKYIGEFYSIDDILYKIEIETKKSGSDKELKLSGNPFIASIESDDDENIYSPIKCGGATIGVLTDYYIEDFYSGEAKGVKVTFTNVTSNKIEWIGYVTPSMYSQGFDYELEEIQVDCVDGIATLKSLQFEINGDTITSFANIIFNCLKQSECYKYFYISDNVQFTQNGTESIIEKLRVSQSNFYDSKKDINQTDDDVAFSYYDVLFEICQFLGYTLIIEGDEVYIIDYDAIRNGNNKYFRYSLESSSLGTSTSINVSFSKHITEGSYAQNGTNIEMTEVYNKVTVKDEFNSYDNVFPTFGDINYETNITAPQANLSSFFHQMTIRDHGLQFGDHIKASPSDGIFEDFCICVDTDWFGNWWLNIFKFYETPVFNMINYSRTTKGQQITLTDNITYGDILSYNGAFYYRWYKADAYRWVDENGNGSNDISEWLNRQKASYNYNASTADKLKIWGQLFEQIKMVDKIELQPIIAFINASDNRFGPGDGVNLNNQTDNDITKNYPYVTLKNYDSSIFGGENHFLRIKGKVCSHDDYVCPHKLNDGKNNKDLKHDPDYKRIEQGYIWCKLKWGNQYWDGNGWVSSDVWFKLYYWDDNDRSSGDKGRGIKVLDYFDKEFEIKHNNYSTLMNIGQEGCIIPCPTTGNLQGKAEISFTTRDMWGDSRRSHWHAKGTLGDNFYTRYYSNCLFISDLEITAEVYEGFLNDADYDSDTLYTNVIENGAVEKMNEITFKVCTDDGKKPSYSSVDYLDNGNSKFVTTLYNKALYSKERGTIGTDGEDAKLRQEEHYVFKVATQYENPMLVFNANLKNDENKMFGLYTDKTINGKTFIATAREVDYRFNKCNLRLVEKF